MPTPDFNLGDSDRVTTVTGYWTFMCNPKVWEIDKFLSTNCQYGTWQIMDYQITEFKKGQLGVIRVGNDNRSKKQLENRKKLEPGVYAIVQILSEAIRRSDLANEKEDEFWLDWDESKKDRYIVKIKYLWYSLKSPILLSDIEGDTDIQTDAYLIKGFAQSSIALKNTAFDKIVQLTLNPEAVFENVKIELLDSVDDIRYVEDKYQNATPQVKEIISKRIERGAISREVKKINKYKCQICDTMGLDPLSFQKLNGEYYIETHHIIHVSKLEKGSLGFLNLITVCANHHRQIHFGKFEIIQDNDESFTFILDEKQLKINKAKISLNEA